MLESRKYFLMIWWKFKLWLSARGYMSEILNDQCKCIITFVLSYWTLDNWKCAYKYCGCFVGVKSSSVQSLLLPLLRMNTFGAKWTINGARYCIGISQTYFLLSVERSSKSRKYKDSTGYLGKIKCLVLFN